MLKSSVVDSCQKLWLDDCLPVLVVTAPEDTIVREAFKLKAEALQVIERFPDSIERYRRARSAVSKAAAELKALPWNEFGEASNKIWPQERGMRACASTSVRLASTVEFVKQ